MRRRVFLGAAATVAARAVGTGYPANDRIRIAAIGTGGRARHLLSALVLLPNVEVSRIADIYDVNADKARAFAINDAVVGRDFRAALNDKSIDAVLVATPDHWHAPIVQAAMEAGKDIYCEKPITHEWKDGVALNHLKENKFQKTIVQVGTQQRSMPHLQEAKALVDSGALGPIFKADITWNRNIERGKGGVYRVDPMKVDWKAFCGSAPEQPLNPYKMLEWRWFWDFGGGLFTDLMVHFLDVALWYRGGTSLPERAVSIGDHIHAAGKWETPDTVQTLLKYAADGSKPAFQVHYEGTFSNAHRGAHLTLMGEKGTLYCDRGRFEFLPEKNAKGALQKILATKPTTRGADFYDLPDGEKLHLANWLDCIRTRKEPNAPLAAGVAAATAAHFANLALRGNGVYTA